MLGYMYSMIKLLYASNCLKVWNLDLTVCQSNAFSCEKKYLTCQIFIQTRLNTENCNVRLQIGNLHK
jgi:hypothetical protein